MRRECGGVRSFQRRAMVSHRSWLVSSAGERRVVYCCRSSCPNSAATRVRVLQAVRSKDWVRAVSMRSAVLTRLSECGVPGRPRWPKLERAVLLRVARGVPPSVRGGRLPLMTAPACCSNAVSRACAARACRSESPDGQGAPCGELRLQLRALAGRRRRQPRGSRCRGCA